MIPDTRSALAVPVLGKGKRIVVLSSLVFFNRIPMVAMCSKDSQDVFNPFTIIGMSKPVYMGKDMRIVPMGLLMTGGMGMLHLMVL